MYTNRLSKEKSPYLLQHAHNPVDWYPWGEEAFTKSKTEDKPIFLSIGYSTCYWCHVMEREVFQNAAISELMNRSLICIKVDREERPDIDRIYMSAVQAMTGQGGWPMSLFLTSDLKPFFGATYIPPTSIHGHPGFPEIVTRINHLWKFEREKIIEAGSRIHSYLNEITTSTGGMILSDSLLDTAYNRIENQFDPTHGGFGHAPKFPRPVVFNFLLRYYIRSGKKEALDMVTATLRAMAAGGMLDHIGGGFHRYSVDNRWRIPHFEKMIYDQAQLSISYFEAFQITRENFYAEIARSTLDYVSRKLSHPDGGFYTAEDAESITDPFKPEGKEEGAFYLWTKDELLMVLNQEEAEIVCYHFGIEESGNALHDPTNIFYRKNVIYLAHSLAETANKFSKPEDTISDVIKSALLKLGNEREKREKPHLDDKIITAWNGLMISAFAKAYAVLKQEEYLNKAVRAERFIRNNLADKSTGLLFRRYRDGEAKHEGGLQDYAFLIMGLLDLYEASFDLNYLETAVELMNKQIEEFGDKINGGFYDTTGKDSSLIIRSKEYYDGAEPTGNSVSALNLFRLSYVMNKPEWRLMAEKTVESLGVYINEIPEAMVQMLVAYQWNLGAPQEIIITGNPDSPEVREYINEVQSRFLPHKVLIYLDSSNLKPDMITNYLPFLKSMIPVGGKPAVYICENYSCQLPVNDINTLRQALDRF